MKPRLVTALLLFVTLTVGPIATKLLTLAVAYRSGMVPLPLYEFKFYEVEGYCVAAVAALVSLIASACTKHRARSIRMASIGYTALLGVGMLILIATNRGSLPLLARNLGLHLVPYFVAVPVSSALLSRLAPKVEEEPEKRKAKKPRIYQLWQSVSRIGFGTATKSRPQLAD